MLVPKKGHKCIINHSLHSFQPCKRSDQWAVSPLQWWWLRKVQVKRHRKKNKFGKHIQTLCQEDSCLLMPLCDGFQESCIYQESRCLFRFRARMSRALHNFCHAERKQTLVITCASSKSCQPCPLNGHSCSNPVHSNHQYRTESTHASVKQWPLWENHSRHSFHFAKGQINEECLLRNFEKAWVWQTPETLCWDELSCWCRCVTASRNPVFIRNHVACSDSEQEWAEHCTTFAMLKENKHLWSLVLVQCFASLANWWGVHAAIQFISNTSTADRHMQWPLWENIRFPVFILAKGQINEECLPRDVESWERWT